MVEKLKEMCDVCNLSALLAWLIGLIPTLPTVALIMSIGYSLMRMYETWLDIKEKKKK